MSNAEQVKLMDNMMNLVVTHADTGNERVYFKEVGLKNMRHPRIFCTQTNWVGEMVMYACSRDGEPSHVVHNYHVVTN